MRLTEIFACEDASELMFLMHVLLENREQLWLSHQGDRDLCCLGFIVWSRAELFWGNPPSRVGVRGSSGNSLPVNLQQSLELTPVYRQRQRDKRGDKYSSTTETMGETRTRQQYRMLLQQRLGEKLPYQIPSVIFRNTKKTEKLQN